MPDIRNQEPGESGLIVVEKGNPDDLWVQPLLELREYARRKRRVVELRWDRAWAVYNNEYDWSGKAKWQSRAFISKAGGAVEMAASLVRRAMLDAQEWFRLEGRSFAMRQFAPYLEKLVYYYLDRMRFADNFVPPMKGGLVGSLIVVKPHLSPYALKDLDGDEIEKVLRGEPVRRDIAEEPTITVGFPDPYNILLDPTGRDMFIIEDEILDFAVARDLADMGVFDGDVLRKIEESWIDIERETKEDARRQQSREGPHPSFRRELKLTHFWGNLPSRSGRWRIKNGHFVIANDKYLIRKPEDNPYSHRKKPYVIGSPFRRPFSVYHKGLVEDVVGLHTAITELVNLILDTTLFSGIKAFEVDLDQIEDPQQLLGGIYPGKVFTKRGGGQQGRMIQDVQISGVSSDIMAVYGLLDNEFQNQTAVTEFISGQTGRRGGRTATEIVAKREQGMGVFSEVARNLEGTVLEPMVEQLAHLIVQYHDDFESDEVVRILGPELAHNLSMLSMDERLGRYDANRISVRASGISSLLNRTEEVNKINALLQSVGQFGQALPTIFQDLDAPFFFKELFRRLIRAFGWNETDFIRAPRSMPVGGEGAVGVAAAAPPGAEPQEGGATPPTVDQTMRQMQKIASVIQAGGIA